MVSGRPANETIPDASRCQKTKRNGERCNNRAKLGNRFCYVHIVPANRKRADERAKDARVIGELRRFAIDPLPDGVEMTGQAQLAIELRRTAAWIAFCEAQLQKLEHERDFVYGLVAVESSSKVSEGTGEKGQAIDGHEATTTERHEAKVNVWVERLDWNRTHMLKITKQWIDAGYEAARLELETRTVEMFFTTMNRAIAALGHDLDDPRVMDVINAAISGVAANKAISA